MIAEGWDRYDVDLLEDEFYGRLERRSNEDLARLQALDWRRETPPALMRRIEAVESEEKRYPAIHRLLPTRLGNTLRAAEDGLKNRRGSLRGFVVRNYDNLPAFMCSLHDQYRTRLDMYCTLVFVFASLAVAAPVLLDPTDDPLLARCSVVAFYLILLATSYRAAVASARSYGDVLQAIDEHLGSMRPTRATNSS